LTGSSPPNDLFALVDANENASPWRPEHWLRRSMVGAIVMCSCIVMS